MDPSKRNAAALHQRIDELCDNFTTQYTSLFAAAAKPTDDNFAEAALGELRIKEESTAMVRSVQDLSTLIRDLQELWLFGSLDTLVDPSDEQANREKALDLARKIEKLSKVKMPEDKDKVEAA